MYFINNGLDFITFINKRPKNPKTDNRRIGGLSAKAISYLIDDKELVKMSVENFIFLMTKRGVENEIVKGGKSEVKYEYIANIIVKNKNNGKILNTFEHGLFGTISIQADGTININELGTCIDTLSKMTPETEENYLDVDDYEIVCVEINSCT